METLHIWLPTDVSGVLVVSFYPDRLSFSRLVPWREYANKFRTVRQFIVKKSFSCSALLVPSCHATTQRKHEAGIQSVCPNLDRGSREAEVEFEPRTFRFTDSCAFVHQLFKLPPPVLSYPPRPPKSLVNKTVAATTSHDISVQHRCFTVVKSRKPQCEEKNKSGEGRDIVLAYHNHSEVPTPPGTHSGNKIAAGIDEQPYLAVSVDQLSPSAMENFSLFGKRRFTMDNAWVNQRSFWRWTHCSMEVPFEEANKCFQNVSLRIRQHWNVPVLRQGGRKSEEISVLPPEGTASHSHTTKQLIV
ncbi:hypothetical protein T265_06541 [Opisthorchis viverrini]|uniref:Uncharacterized protein n=1 Tax=Opisthorchis viverrini TaxID=6198 RepID=A0A074ZFZ2_OPIVI|nr:hypothetical protein T265_06541 [Opisthorchis viverrini]KER26123.1 hypothetical protein T265_06541 [Opisthorchis viverrini]